MMQAQETGKSTGLPDIPQTTNRNASDIISYQQLSLVSRPVYFRDTQISEEKRIQRFAIGIFVLGGPAASRHFTNVIRICKNCKDL
jgi:hypothetical protein